MLDVVEAHCRPSTSSGDTIALKAAIILEVYISTRIWRAIAHHMEHRFHMEQKHYSITENPTISYRLHYYYTISVNYSQSIIPPGYRTLKMLVDMLPSSSTS